MQNGVACNDLTIRQPAFGSWLPRLYFRLHGGQPSQEMLPKTILEETILF
jgi:hypothetical protein